MEELCRTEEKSEGSARKKTLARKLALQGIKAAVWGVTIPVLSYGAAAITRPITGINLEEFADNPHVLLSGVYSYALDSALILAKRANRLLKTKIYSQKIVDLEDQLIDAGRERRTSDFEGLVENLHEAFEERGKPGESRIRKAQKTAYLAAISTTLAKLKQAVREGDLDTLEEEWRTGARISEEAGFSIFTYSFMAPLSRLQKRCAQTYVKKTLADLDAKLDGLPTAASKKAMRKYGYDHGLFGHQPDYSEIRKEINRLKAVSSIVGPKEEERVRNFEHEFEVLELLNTQLSELYDFSRRERDLKAVEERFLRIRPTLNNYSDSVLDEAYKRILKPVRT